MHAEQPSYTAVLPQAEQPLAEQLSTDEQPSVPTSAVDASDALSELLEEGSAVGDEEDPVELLTRRPEGLKVGIILIMRSVQWWPRSAACWPGVQYGAVDHVAPPHCSQRTSQTTRVSSSHIKGCSNAISLQSMLRLAPSRQRNTHAPVCGWLFRPCQSS